MRGRSRSGRARTQAVKPSMSEATSRKELLQALPATTRRSARVARADHPAALLAKYKFAK